jgi:hypothetical protein
MQEDERCCGTGTCIIDAQGHCWCGQQWDGEKMSRKGCLPDVKPANSTQVLEHFGVETLRDTDATRAGN